LHINTQTHKTSNPKATSLIIRALDARNHYPQIKHHTPPPKPVRQQQPPPPPTERRLPPPQRERSERACCLRTQQCVWQFFTPNASQPDERSLYAPTGPTHYRRRRQSQPPHPTR